MARPTPLGAGPLLCRCAITPCPRGLRRRNRQRHLHLFLYEAQPLFRSRDGAPILPHRLQLLLVDEPIGVYCYARSWFVHHGINLGKGFPVAHKPGCVVVSSCIMLGNEDVPLLSQLPQRRGVAVVGFLVDEECYSLRQTLPILLFTKTQFLERGHVFGATDDLCVCPISHVSSHNRNSHERTRRCGCYADIDVFRCSRARTQPPRQRACFRPQETAARLPAL